MSVRVGVRWMQIGHRMIDLCRITNVKSRSRLWCLFDEDKPYKLTVEYQENAKPGDNGKRSVHTRQTLEECKQIKADIEKAQDNLLNNLNF